MGEPFTHPMSANNPARRLWPPWLKGYWPTTHKTWWFGEHSEVARRLLVKAPLRPLESLTKLAFINFARWSTVDRVARGVDEEPKRLERTYVLFETNFNGD